MLASGVALHQEESFGTITPVNGLTESLKNVRPAYERLESSETEMIDRKISVLLHQMKTANDVVITAKTDAVEGHIQLHDFITELEDEQIENVDLATSEISTMAIGDENEEARVTTIDLEEKFQELRKIFVNHLADHKTLMDLKRSLELEIATHRRLLEKEEDSKSSSIKVNNEESLARKAKTSVSIVQDESLPELSSSKVTEEIIAVTSITDEEIEKSVPVIRQSSSSGYVTSEFRESSCSELPESDDDFEEADNLSE